MRRCSGVSLLEVLVGLAVFSIGVLPMLLAQTRAANTARYRGLVVAEAILAGECRLLYETGARPPLVRAVTLDGREYQIRFACDADSPLAVWRMRVVCSGDTLGRLGGLVYLDGDRP